jgi:PAS domain S-box-containing protein
MLPQCHDDGLPSSSVSSSLQKEQEFAWTSALIQTALDGIIIIDHLGRIEEFNPAAERIFGYIRDEVIGNLLADCIIPPAFRAAHHRGLMRYLATEEGHILDRRQELIGMRADGTEFPVELTVTRLHQEGAPRFMGTLRDITERATLEDQLRAAAQAEQQARAAAEALAERLQVLQTINEVLFRNSHTEDLLHELLTTVRTALRVENAAILLPTPDNTVLMMHAVQGPEEAVATKVRVPIGQGVAGRILATRQPCVIDDLTTSEVITPFLREHLCSLLGVPLLIDDRAVGVLHVSTIQTRHFTAEDRHLLELVAQRIAVALERAQTRDALQQAKAQAEARAAQLEAIFTAMTDGVFVMDAQGRVLHQNPAAARLLHREKAIDPVQERPSRTAVWDAQGFPIPENDLPFRRILRGETLSGPNTVDLQLRLADDQMIAVSLSGAPIRDGQGEVVAALSICRDVTERRHLERRTHAALKALLDLAQVLVDGDATGKGRSLQAAAQQVLMVTRQVLGCQRVAIMQVEVETDQMSMLAVDGVSMETSPSSTASTSLRESLPSDLLQRLHEGEAMFIDMTQPPWHTRPNPHGAKVIEIFPMRIGSDLVGLLTFDYGGTDHPLTPDEHALAVAVAQLAALVLERERLIAAREKSQAHVLALQESQHRMDQFLSLASHEIRTPLTHCKGGVQLALRRLERVLTDPQQGIVPEQLYPVQEILTATDRQTSRLVRLVKDLLDVSRIQLAALEMRLGDCDVVAVVRETVGAHLLAKPDRVIHLTAPDTPLLIRADADRIGQVVQNLLTNALKFAPPDRPIQVQFIAEGAQVRVEVQDEGPGVPLDQQERIFERFYQVEHTAVARGSEVGLGLGLFLARHIIEAHHGQIGVQSEGNMGATFFFILPLATAADQTS